MYRSSGIGRIICFCLLIFISCTMRDPAPAASPAPYAGAIAMIHESTSVLRDGDLLLRDGQEFSSQLIKQFNRHDQSYSHSGIVFIEDGKPVVYHIIPAEEGSDDTMKKDSLEKFCNPRKNSGFAIYRYDLSGAEISLLKTQVMQWYSEKIRFDSAFDYQSNQRMYCSEMIRKGLEKVTKERIVLPVTRPSTEEASFFSPHLNIPADVLAKLDIISIDNLFINPHCQLIRKFDFNSAP